MNDSREDSPHPDRPKPVDFAGLALELGFPPGSIGTAIDDLRRAGLFEVQPPEARDQPPTLTRAGEQFLAMRGDIDHDTLFFLPEVVDDLHARSALILAGTTLVARFRQALLDGTGVEHARELVPPAFAAAVTTRLAYDLFASAVALMARLSAGDPAGCIAEEILAVRLLEIADARLDHDAETGALGDEEAAAAKEAARGLFELFEDDEVLGLFEMHEPSDAAPSGSDADQRLEAWFQPFGGTAGTGHLDA
jgi:hypothetical protein